MIEEFYPANVYDLIKKNQLFRSYDKKQVWKIFRVNDSDIWVCERYNRRNRHCFNLQDVVGSFIEGVWIPLIEIPEYLDCAKCNFRHTYVEAKDLVGTFYCYKCKIGF